MQFRYQAVDEQGRTSREMIEAASLVAATEQLSDRGIEVTSIEAFGATDQRYEPDGMRPGPAPRDISVSIGDMAAGWALVFGGGIFAAAAAVFIAVGIGMLVSGNGGGIFFALFPLIHLVVGLVLLLIPLRNRARRQRIYRHGEVTMARIDAVGYDRSLTVNGENPYEVVWTFDIDGHRYHDKRSTFSTDAQRFRPGDPIWIIYDPFDPEESVEWPPISGRR